MAATVIEDPDVDVTEAEESKQDARALSLFPLSSGIRFEDAMKMSSQTTIEVLPTWKILWSKHSKKEVVPIQIRRRNRRKYVRIKETYITALRTYKQAANNEKQLNMLKALKIKKYIVLNMEQIDDVFCSFRSNIDLLRGAEAVLDWSKPNRNCLDAHCISSYAFPSCWASFKTIFCANQTFASRDIDVLFVGVLSRRRMDIKHQLQRYGLNVLFSQSLYGSKLESALRRTKIVLNVRCNPDWSSLEIHRISSFIPKAGKVVLISEKSGDDELESWLNFGIYEEYDKIASTAKRFIRNKELWEDKASQTLEWFKDFSKSNSFPPCILDPIVFGEQLEAETKSGLDPKPKPVEPQFVITGPVIIPHILCENKFSQAVSRGIFETLKRLFSSAMIQPEDRKLFVLSRSMRRNTFSLVRTYMHTGMMTEVEKRTMNGSKIILANVEYIHKEPSKYTKQYLTVANKACLVLDWSSTNIENWKKYGIDAVLFPTCWCWFRPDQICTTNTAYEDRPIDVYLCAERTPRRTALVAKMTKRHIRVYYATEEYGAQKAVNAAKAKIILNYHANNLYKSLEMNTITDLMPKAGHAVMVSEASDDKQLQEWFDFAIYADSDDELIDQIEKLLSDHDAWHQKAKYTLEWFQRFAADPVFPPCSMDPRLVLKKPSPGAV